MTKNEERKMIELIREIWTINKPKDTVLSVPIHSIPVPIKSVSSV
ncbi:hypothetical protein [Candidatus Cloacimonas acidaminovorans]|nr:hypothetical protein [Candidatus Cloacimonas acidaminovorans]